MKRIVLAILLLQAAQSAVLPAYITVETVALDISSMAIAGPNQEYVVQGKFQHVRVYQIDWVTPAATLADTFDFGTAPAGQYQEDTRIESDGGHNCVMTSDAVWRFSVKPGQPHGFELFSTLPTNVRYGYPHWLPGTNYIFVSNREFGANKNVYRLHSDSIAGIKTFTVGAFSRSYGTLWGTTLLVVSLDSSNDRKVFDYTKDFDGSPNASPAAIHTKSPSHDEIGMFSPEDGRQFYVVCTRGSRKMITTKYDGTSWPNHDFGGSIDFATHNPAWIRDSDFAVVPAWGTNFAIVNFVDLAKPAPAYHDFDNGGKDCYKPGVWHDYKAYILPNKIPSKSFIYKALAEIPFGDLCGTCDGIFRKKCLTCGDPNSSKSGDTCICNNGFYSVNTSPTKKKCLACSQFCGTCSGGAATNCLTCKYSYMERKGDGTCGCPAGKYLSGTSCLDCDSTCATCSGPGPSGCLSCDISRGRYLAGSTCPLCDSSCSTCSGGSSSQCLSCTVSSGRYLSGSSCSICHSVCSTCSGGSSKECLSCSDLGYFVDSGSCSSCAAKDSTDCPVPTTISIQNEIEELTQNLTITFSPAFTSSLPSTTDLTADALVQNHLNLKFKRKSVTTNTNLKIINKTLTHEHESSKLHIEFLQKMRISNTEHLIVSVKDPWVYKPAIKNQIVYFKQKIYNLKLTKSKKLEEEKGYKMAEKIAKVLRGAIGATALATSLAAACSGSTTFVAYLAKFFNIIDILSNLANLNIQFGSRFKVVMRSIESLTVPELKFLAKLSPLKDSEYDDPDADAYRKKARGTRGKMTAGNGEVFIINGQDFMFSLIIVILWVLVKILGFCFDKKSKILTFSVFFYQFMIGLMFFDYQFVCGTEIAFFDYQKIRKVPGKYDYSLMISMVILVLIVSEFFEAYELITKNLFGGKVHKSSSDGRNFVVEKYTDGTNTEQPGVHNYLILVGNVRFFVIQIVIFTLQLLNRTQALLVMVIDLAFFVFFLRVVCSRTPAFSSKIVQMKESFQEGCVLVVMLTITLFSFTENTSFSSSIVYQAIELLAVGSIIGAVGSEFLMLCSAMLGDLISCFRREKQGAKVAQGKRIIEKKEELRENAATPQIGFKKTPLEQAKGKKKLTSQRKSRLGSLGRRMVFRKRKRGIAAKNQPEKQKGLIEEKKGVKEQGWHFWKESDEKRMRDTELKKEEKKVDEFWADLQ